MAALKGTGQKWLKAVHIFFAALWTSGGITLILMGLFMHPGDGGTLHGIDVSKRFVDDFIVIPGAIGSLLTGLIYSIWTRWGFFRYWWVAVKWMITVGGVLFGTFFLGPWLNSLPPISADLGLAAYQNPVYMTNMELNQNWSYLQVSSVIFALVISSLKPWGRISKSA
jgi:uncharacterized membrane protein